MKELKEAARRAANRLNFRFGLVTNRNLIRDLMSHNRTWFGGAKSSLNTVLLKRPNGEIFTLDLMHSDLNKENAVAWINRKMVRDIEPFTEELFYGIKRQCLIAFVDFGNEW